MSKRSLFWGQASGKLGEAVYYRAGGEQRTRSYVAKIKNPKTRAQALQRTKFNNMVAVFRGTSVFVKSLFKAEKSSQSPFNAFVKRNFPLCLTVADKEMVELGEGGSQNFVFANGSVNFNTVPSIIPFKPLGNEENTLGYYWGLAIAGGDVNSPRTVVGDIVGLYTGAEIYQALVGTTNPYNLPAQFALSFIECIQGNVAPSYYTYTVNCAADSTDTLRCVQFPRGAEPPTLAELQAKIIPQAASYTSGAGDKKIQLTGITGILFGSGNAASSDITNGVAICLSYRDSAGLQATTSIMTYGKSLQEQANEYLPSASAGSSVIDSYMIISDKIGE
ncbi:hypothetical protein [Janthinobacterium sp. HLS12-2]|uniref:hypothetical protein n=1 Tax=Janthinobacterium sp. HLS12-2 TaxID=1259324 RepID=UPI003F22E551